MDPLQEQGTGIDKMEAGREMDALVEKELSMGIAYEFPPGMITALPHYSTDISAAWLVVEKMDTHFMLERYGRIEVDSGALDPNMGTGIDITYPIEWVCTLDIGDIKTGIAPIAPLAICRAALKAVEMVDVIGLGNG